MGVLARVSINFQIRSENRVASRFKNVYHHGNMVRRKEGGESDDGEGRGTTSIASTNFGQPTDNMAKCDWYHCASFPRRLRFRERLSRCQALDVDLE